MLRKPKFQIGITGGRLELAMEDRRETRGRSPRGEARRDRDVLGLGRMDESVGKEVIARADGGDGGITVRVDALERNRRRRWRRLLLLAMGLRRALEKLEEERAVERGLRRSVGGGAAVTHRRGGGGGDGEEGLTAGLRSGNWDPRGSRVPTFII